MNKTIFFNHYFDKRRFNYFLYWFLKNNNKFELCQFLEKLKSFGFQYATEIGFSIGIDDLKISFAKSKILSFYENFASEVEFKYSEGTLTEIEYFQRIIEIWNRASEKLKNKAVQSFKILDFLNPVYLMAFSGARGNISQVRQLIGMRGLMVNPQGEIIDFPIRSNFREGLTLIEYLISCSGARKGVIDTAIRTATSGYLTRRLVDIAHHVIVYQIDCGSKYGIFIENLFDKEEKIISLNQRIIGRVLAEKVIIPETGICVGKENQEISKALSLRISKFRKRVKIRSPLTCQSSKFICQLCYGWNLAEGQLVSIGEAVGILAAQSIGEPGTQLTMRTFHTGGIFTGVLVDQIYSPLNGKVNYFSSYNGLLVRTQQGRIAYLSREWGFFKILSFKFIFDNLTLLYVKQKQHVRQYQLILEIGFQNDMFDADLKKQEIYSPVSGEIIFENFYFFKNKIKGFGQLAVLYGNYVLHSYFFKKCDFVNKRISFSQVGLGLIEKNILLPIIFKKITYLDEQNHINKFDLQIVYNQIFFYFLPNWYFWRIFIKLFQKKKKRKKKIYSTLIYYRLFFLTFIHYLLHFNDDYKLKYILGLFCFIRIRIFNKNNVYSVRFPKLFNIRYYLFKNKNLFFYINKKTIYKYREKIFNQFLSSKSNKRWFFLGTSTVDNIVSIRKNLFKTHFSFLKLCEIIKNFKTRFKIKKLKLFFFCVLDFFDSKLSLHEVKQNFKNYQTYYFNYYPQEILIPNYPSNIQIVKKYFPKSLETAIFLRFFVEFTELNEITSMNENAILTTTCRSYFTFYKKLIKSKFVAKLEKKLLFRKTEMYFLSNKNILYVKNGDLITDDSPLWSVFSPQIKTNDIVQGIPKIEEIFEARKKINSKYFQNIQKSIINDIQRIYCSQGVQIADKHIEIIVRQMTSNAVILDPGKTNLLYGEVIMLQWVFKLLNLKISIIYKPIVLGMTKTCTKTSSFISAASFQETTSILSRAAIQHKKDFLRGLKQNVILGNFVPMGTSFFLDPYA